MDVTWWSARIWSRARWLGTPGVSWPVRGRRRWLIRALAAPALAEYEGDG